MLKDQEPPPAASETAPSRRVVDKLRHIQKVPAGSKGQQHQMPKAQSKSRSRQEVKQSMYVTSSVVDLEQGQEKRKREERNPVAQS